ncbi:MAG: DcaP family trimeric outer membrane transporter [Anderseniella sp.]
MTMLRKALLGGAALAVMTTGAAADELSTLKAQLADLQNQVNQIQSQPAQAPAGSSFLRYERGLGGNTWGVDAVKDQANANDNSGFTVAITPVADLPAPVAEITVYGYVAGHISYDFDENHGVANSFSKYSTDDLGANTGDHISLTAKQSRFGIRSKIYTAIGQIRTQIEGDFLSGGRSGSTLFRARHLVGHWDMTPNWTLTVGQTWFTAALLPIGVSTVDFYGSLLTYSRAPQIRLGYADGPLSWAVAIENPSLDTTTNMPNIASFVQYDIAGGHQIILTGEVADWNGRGATAFHNDELAWAVQVGANFNIADVTTLTAGFGYGEGLLDQKFMFGLLDNGAAGVSVDANNDPLETMAFLVGLSFNLSETTSFNTMFSYAENVDSAPQAAQLEKVYKVHANILWQPVKQMRMGWEVIWAQSEDQAGVEEDGVRATFGTWFFF